MHIMCVIFDSRMSLNDQIAEIVKKSLRILGFVKNISSVFRNASTLVHLYKSLLLPIWIYCSSICLSHTQTALNELIAIKHKFLRFVSRRTPVPMHFFDHDYTAIRSFLRLPFLRNMF